MSWVPVRRVIVDRQSRLLRVIAQLDAGELEERPDETATRALDTRAFYVVPRVNPDGAELYFADKPRFLRSSVRPYPYDEEPIEGLKMEDADGDGRILQMRVPDPNGPWKPHPDARSVLDELRHVTIGLEMTTAEAKGEKFDFEAREKADATKPKTRASVVAEMEAAIAASYPLVKSKPRPQLIGWLEHQGEHYGKLVTAYRANGVVPPVSRPK